MVTYEKQISKQLSGSKDNKPIRHRHAALMHFKKPLRKLLRAAAASDTKGCMEQGTIMAQELKKQSHDLLVAATYGWEAVSSGGDSDSDNPISRRERKKIKQRLARTGKQQQESSKAPVFPNKQSNAGFSSWPKGSFGAPCYNCKRHGHIAAHCPYTGPAPGGKA